MIFKTLIINGELGGIVRGPTESAVAGLIPQGATVLAGAFPKSQYKLVAGEPVELSEDEALAKIPQSRNPWRRHAQWLTAELQQAGHGSGANLPVNHDEWTQTDARQAIDLAAGRARARVVSPGVNVADEYRLTQQQVSAWRAAGSPLDAVPATLQSWMDATGWDANTAATDIEQSAASMESALVAIRAQRLAGKAAVNAATSQIYDVALPFITALDALGA